MPKVRVGTQIHGRACQVLRNEGYPHRNDPVDVVRPCGVCGKPITTAEICQECADDSEIDAFTHPNEAWEEATGGNNGE